MSATSAGPYVQAAILCERVLQEGDGTYSIIRMVNRVNINGGATGAPPSMPTVPLVLTSLISLQPDQAQGSHELRLGWQAPSGLRTAVQSILVNFEGEDRAVSVVVNPLILQTNQQGLYWFEVRLDGDLLTRVPLRVVYQWVGQPRQ